MIALDFEESMIQLFVKWLLVSMTETEHDVKPCNARMKWGKGAHTWFIFVLFVIFLTSQDLQYF